MRNSAPSARPSTRGSRRWAPSARWSASIAISISREPAATWIGGALKALAPEDDDRGRVIEVDFTHKPTASAASDIVEAEIIEHVNLNSSRSDKETVHLALQIRRRGTGL